jgi:hypothetical protein
MIQKSSSMELKQWLNLGLSRFQIQHHISDKGKRGDPNNKKKTQDIFYVFLTKMKTKDKG